jgi:hypothetical protein
MGEALRFVKYLREMADREAVLARLRAADAQGMTLVDVITALSTEL